MAGHRDPQRLGLNASVEALHHAIGFGRVGPRFAVLHPERPAGRLEPVSREAGAAVREHMGDLEGKSLDGLRQEGHGATRGFVVLDREMDEAGGAVDGDIQVATYRYRLRLWPSWVRSLGRRFTSTCTKPRS